MPVVNLAGEGLGPLDVASGTSTALTLRVVLSDDSTISIEEDKNYGVVGANTIRTAAQIGNATGAADFGSGADSAQTLRVTPSTRSETATTPLAVRLSDGTAFYAGATEATVASIDSSATSIDGKTPSLGQALMTASVPVAIASDQSTLPISAASLPLPTGAATESSLVAMSAKLPATLGQKVSAQSMSVTIASDQSDIDVAQAGTWNITNITGTVSLPTGASTEATLATLSGKVANDYGAAAGAIRTAAQVGNASGIADFDEGASGSQTLRVVLADESKPQLGLAPVAVITRAYSSINVTGTYSSLGAPLASQANMVAFFETGGVPLIVGWGSADKFIIPPGGAESPLPVTIPAATQLQIKTADGSTVSSGNLYMTVLG